VLGHDLRQVSALQQADLGGGIAGGAGADGARLHHQHVLAGAGQQHRGHQARDTGAHDDDVGGTGALFKSACGPGLLDSIGQP
jgi:hypothetical protein